MAIRMAAAKKEMFDDVVMSNDEDLESNRGVVSVLFEMLQLFEREKERELDISSVFLSRCSVKNKKFTSPTNDTSWSRYHARCCEQIQDKLEEETERQNDMSRSAREIY